MRVEDENKIRLNLILYSIIFIKNLILKRDESEVGPRRNGLELYELKTLKINKSAELNLTNKKTLLRSALVLHFVHVL